MRERRDTTGLLFVLHSGSEVERVYSMCGIIGYIGNLDAKDVLIEGLTSLEYRGYDSAGIALLTEMDQKPVQIMKATGKVSCLKALCDNKEVVSHCGIGHTRWATHGGVTTANTHPHVAGNVTLIHNGIVENYHEIQAHYHLGEDLLSETDTEVAAKLLNSLYEQHQGEPMRAIAELIQTLEGSYAFCILFSDLPGEIYAVRNVSPLIAAYTEAGALIASDLTALIPYTKTYTVIPEYTIVRMTGSEIKMYDLMGEIVHVPAMTVTWNTEAAQKNGYPHYMLKEIHEQPEAVTNTIRPRKSNGLPDFSEDQIPDSIFEGCQNIRIVACGTAMHAGIVVRLLMESMLRIPVTVSIASEFRYETPLIDEKTLVIVISQSGETIDTLASLKLAGRMDAKTLAVVNVKGSTIARESDYVLYTHAGPEIAVASTKAFSVQLAALYLICCRMALVNHNISSEQAADFVRRLEASAEAMKAMFEKEEQIKQLIPQLIAKEDAFFLGRGVDYALSLEGALKLKEISYIHAEAYAAGELKHGTIALIEAGIPVIALATQDYVFPKTISNIREVKARGAFVIMIAKDSAVVSDDVCDVLIRVPELDDYLMVFPVVVLLQMIAYCASAAKGLDVDQPRNLAKSVTVE